MGGTVNLKAKRGLEVELGDIRETTGVLSCLWKD